MTFSNLHKSGSIFEKFLREVLLEMFSCSWGWTDHFSFIFPCIFVFLVVLSYINYLVWYILMDITQVRNTIQPRLRVEGYLSIYIAKCVIRSTQAASGWDPSHALVLFSFFLSFFLSFFSFFFFKECSSRSQILIGSVQVIFHKPLDI